jgi:hypothetical protein
MSMEAYEFVVGTPVWTSDQHHLGEIKEISGRYFKVDAAMQPDYWLPGACVRSSTPTEVVLAVPEDAVGDQKVEEAAVRSQLD